MKALQLFSHRPPTSGIHLLSDPFPERLNGTASMFARAEILSSNRAFFSASRRSSGRSDTAKK